MAVSDAWPFQQAVYSAVSAALASEGLAVFDHVPTNPPKEFVRLEGFDINDASWKDTERGRHPVMIRVVTRPVDDTETTLGQKRLHDLSALIHDAIKDLRYGRGRMQFEFKNVESDDDGATMMALLRYTIVI